MPRRSAPVVSLETSSPDSTLLAVDVGLRTGLALFGADGRVRWYRSQNYGSAARLKRGAYGLVTELREHLSWVVIEGGGPLGDVWTKEAVRRDIPVLRTQAHAWRSVLLYDRERRSGSLAKQYADGLARRIIEWSGAAAPTSLRHDAAEAVLVGLWGVLEVGWLTDVPSALRQGA